MHLLAVYISMVLKEETFLYKGEIPISHVGFK